jgi:fatty acid desaturase
MLRRFRKDPYFLLKYNLANAAVVSALLVMSRHFFPDRFEFTRIWFFVLAVFLAPNFFVIVGGGLLIPLVVALEGGLDGRAWPLALIPLAGYVAFGSALFMHNTAHGNVGPRWLNRAVGEFVGFHQLGGYAAWTIVHLVHHSHPDHPEKDPHPPGTMSFMTYMRTMFSALIRCLTELYHGLWIAKDERYRFVFKLTGTLGVIVRYGRTLALLVILGPKVFAFFFAPFYVFLTLIYWHFNYATHRPTADGMEILDLNQGLYYRIINTLFAGCYYHRTHHAKPHLFDASRAALPARPASARGISRGMALSSPTARRS